MAEKEYQRLTRPSAMSGINGLIARSSLWLGKDHLLRMDSTGYSERYKRFYFRDIQSITTHVTLRRTYWNWFLGVPSAVFILGGIPYYALGYGNGPSEWIPVSIFAMLFVIPLIVNNVLGTTCTCKVKTAVQIEMLPIRRLARVRKVLTRVQPLIIAAQEQRQTAENAPTPGAAAYGASAMVPGEAPLSPAGAFAESPVGELGPGGEAHRSEPAASTVLPGTAPGTGSATPGNA